MTYPIRSVPDADTNWGPDIRAAIAGVNDHQTRVTSLESSSGTSSTIPANVRTASYTLVLSDAGKVIEMNSASAVTLTIPLNSSVAFATGTVIEVLQYGAGKVSVAGASGVTVRTPTGFPAGLRGQYSAGSLRKRGTDEWVLAGDLG